MVRDGLIGRDELYVDPSVLFAAWESVLGIVDGHHLNVPRGRRAADGGGVLQKVAAVA